MSINQLRNGSFELGNTNFWILMAGSEFAVSEVQKVRGVYSGKVKSDVIGCSKIRNNDYIAVKEGQIAHLKASFYAAESAIYRIYCWEYDDDLSLIEEVIHGEALLGNQWETKEEYFAIEPEVGYIKISVGMVSAGNDADVYYDNVRLEILEVKDFTARDLELIAVEDETTEHTAYGAEFFTGVWKEAEYFLKCTSLTGTTPTLDVTIQAYDPNIDAWTDIMVFQQLDAAGSERKTLLNGLGWKQRVKYTTADGTTLTDCDFKVGAIYKR